MKSNMDLSGFDKTRREHENRKKEVKVSNPPKRVKERKEQMSIVLTPTDKVDLREMSDNVGMSASELIAHWIEANR